MYLQSDLAIRLSAEFPKWWFHLTKKVQVKQQVNLNYLHIIVEAQWMLQSYVK